MNQIYGREIYPVKKKNVFQSFTADESWKKPQSDKGGI
jgi:lysine N6-hydroxylase